MLRQFVLGLSAVTILTATFAGTASLFDTDASVLWTVAKLAACALVIGVGIVTWLERSSKKIRLAAPLFFGSIAMVVLGFAGVAWTLRIARATGDLEAWVIAVNVVWVLQGLLTGWELKIRPQRVGGSGGTVTV